MIEKNENLKKIENVIKITLLTVILILFSCSTDNNSVISDESNVFKGDITIYTQEDVINLGEKKYTKITGNLLIEPFPFNEDTTQITTLQPLKTLEEVGSLIIITTDSLYNLDGLDNLKTIKEKLSLKYNQLTNINGLKKLEFIGKELSICQSQLLELKVLEKVSSEIEETILIQINGLESLDGLPKIASTGSFFKIANTKIQSLDNDFPIIEFKGTIEIQSNNYLENLSALKTLKNIGTDLIIRDNASLKSLDDLQSLTNINGFLQIKDNKALNDFCSLNNLKNKTILNVEIDGNAHNPQLTNLSNEACKLD